MPTILEIPMTSPTTDRRLGLSGNVAIKAPVACATTAAITLSGEQTIDGVTTSSSRVLVKNQANSVYNGIYDSSTSSWTRAIDCNGTYDVVVGTLVEVTGGTTYGGSFFAASGTAPIVVGTSALTWTTAPLPIGSVAANLADTASVSNGDAMIGVLLQVTGALARTQHDKNAEILSLGDMLTANGTADVTTKFNDLLTYAASIGAYVDVTPGTYVISGLVIVPNGVKGVRGKGGVIKVSAAITGSCGIILAGPTASVPVVVNCIVRDLLIDANNAGNGTTSSVIGIWGQNTLNAQILNNRIYNMAYGYGILLRQYSGSTDGGANIVMGNIVTGTLLNGSGDPANWFAIAVEMESIYDIGYTDATTQWRLTHLAPNNAARIAATSSAYQDGNIIIGNRCIGGYYGFSLQALTNSTVANNTAYGQQRGISLQNSASGNVVVGNRIQENFSAGIHMAYGSCDNTVMGNRITTTIGGGEALIQMYLGSKRNRVEGNLTSDSGSGNQFHIYCGVHASDNRILRNECRGTTTRAYIAAESSWNFGETDVASYAYGKTFTNGVATEATTGVVIDDNIIDGSSAVPAVFLSQVNDGTAWALEAEVTNNRVVQSTHNYQLKLKEDTASNLAGLRLTNNRFNFAATLAKFLFPRGRGHFAVCRDNDILNAPGSATGFYSFTDGDTSPSVGVADTWKCANTAPTSITMFDDGADMQELEILGDANTTLVHNASKIILKGAANQLLTASAIMKLRRIGGIWYEVSRNI